MFTIYIIYKIYIIYIVKFFYHILHLHTRKLPSAICTSILHFLDQQQNLYDTNNQSIGYAPPFVQEVAIPLSQRLFT